MNALAQADAIMAAGHIGRCGHEIPKGHCSCCKFDTGLGNWIGLVEGERDYLEKGDTSNWTTVREGQGIVCGRLKAAEAAGEYLNCTNRPLDCKFYPFYPAECQPRPHVVEGQGPVYRWRIIAGFPKCPLRANSGLDFAAYNYAELAASQLEMQQHLGRVVHAAAVLWPEHGERMAALAAGYRGYEREFFVWAPADLGAKSA